MQETQITPPPLGSGQYPVQPSDQLEKFKSLLTVVQWIGLPVLALIISYGASRATNAALIQDVENLKAKVSDMEKQRGANEDRYVTKDFLDAKLEGIRVSVEAQTKTLERIENNMRRGK